jgi:hypothetical protein
VIIVLVGLLTRAAAAIIQMLYGVNNVVLPGIQVFKDYYIYYVPQLHYLSEGYVLYKDIPYLYMPGFLYSLLPFYTLLGAHGPAIVMVVTDALSAGLIYRIVRTQIAGGGGDGSNAGNSSVNGGGSSSSNSGSNNGDNNRSAEILGAAAGLSYALFPLAIVSEGYLWFSTEPMLFLMLASLYLAQTKKTGLAFVVLAVAVGMKQEAVFMLPGLLLMARGDIKHALMGLAAGAGILFAMVLPFLITVPRDFISSVTVDGIKFPSYAPSQLDPSNPWGIYNTTAPSSLGTIQCHQVSYWFYQGAVCGTVSPLQLFINRIYLVIGQALVAAYPMVLVLSLGAVVFMGVRRGPPSAWPQAVMGVSFLALLALVVNQSWGYAVIPAYALLLTTVTSKRSLAVAGVVLGVEILTPVYPIQIIILSIGFVLTTVMLQATE